MINQNLKIVITLVTISTMLLFPFAVTRAAGAIMYILKEFALDVAARLITRTIMTKLSNGMMGEILKLGRDGGPTFVQDWRLFLQGAQYRGENILSAMVADATMGSSATVCPYLRSSIARVFNAAPIQGFNSSAYRLDSVQPYKIVNGCTLPSSFNVGVFRNDFSAGGGWETWSKLLEPQNNFLGVYQNTSSELSKQRGFEQGTDQSEAVSGNGNTSARDKCRGTGANQQCTIMGVVITPGTVFSETESATINKEMDWLISADELSEVIANLATSVLGRLADYAAGAILSGVSAGDSYDASGALGQAKQDCVDNCTSTSCPSALPACIDNNKDGVSDNRPCTPNDPDPSQSCNDLGRATFCQQRCNF